MTFDPRAYRAALGCFATGVTIVTVRDANGVVHGRTVNSFTSISMNPPLVMWALGNYSSAFETYTGATRYGVSILDDSAEDLALRFAGRGDQVLSDDEWIDGPEGVPVLAGALASLECEITEIIPAGDHAMLMAQSLTYQSRPGDGLTYFRGSFGRAATISHSGQD
jgi:flavin reductase (DIM6/NTAB) family NADH-FMN oxidoreductase RutF